MSPAAAAEPRIPVLVQTVPATQGIAFSLEGNDFVSDEDGLAIASVGSPGTYELEVETRKRSMGDSTRVFAFWSDHSRSPTNKIEVETFTLLQAGFDTQVPATFSFVGAGSSPVPQADSVTLVDQLGEKHVLDEGSERIDQSRVVATDTGLREQAMTYVVERAIVDGIDAAAEDQAPFTLIDDPRPEIELGLNEVKVDVSDALFGSPLTSTVRIEYPSGRSKSLQTDEEGTANLGKLPPGKYRAIVQGPGFGRSTTFSPHESDTVSMRLITVADLGVAALILLAAAAGLLAVTPGRRLLRTLGARPRAQPTEPHPPPEVRPKAPTLRFARLIEGHVDDRRRALDDWLKWCESLAESTIHHTVGYSDDGRVAVLIFAEAPLSFSDDESAPPYTHFVGPAVVHESDRVDASLFGNWSQAGCVQLIHGRAHDVARLEELTQEMRVEVEQSRPDVLAHILIHHDDGLFTEAVYFTSEQDAQAEDGKRSARLEQLTREWEQLVEDLDFVGLQIHRRTGLWDRAPRPRTPTPTTRQRRGGLAGRQRPRGGSPTR